MDIENNHPSSDSHKFIGDILVDFNTNQEASVSRSAYASWSLREKNKDWRLWLHPAEHKWKGYPLRYLPRGNWKIWLLGELYGSPGLPDVAADLIEGIVFGQRLASQLNGHFLLLAWDDLTEKWHIWTDRFGTLHAYYASDGKAAASAPFSRP